MRALFAVFLSFVFSAATACAADAGRVKTVTGDVHIERGAQRFPAMVDAPVQQADTIVTGANGSVGVTFADDSRMAAGPGSRLVIDRYVFDPATHAGTMDATLRRGTLAVVSGRMVKRSPESLTVTTPGLVLGIRGTEFVVYAE